MNNISTLFKLNGLIFLLLGALFVFLPLQTVTFLSSVNPAPEVMILSVGIGFNLLGLLSMWLGNQQNPNTKWLKFIAVIDFIWGIGWACLIGTNMWVTNINGMTTAGLIAIFIGWFGWALWTHSNKTHTNSK